MPRPYLSGARPHIPGMIQLELPVLGPVGLLSCYAAICVVLYCHLYDTEAQSRTQLIAWAGAWGQTIVKVWRVAAISVVLVQPCCFY
jgi:hypothetical protein